MLMHNVAINKRLTAHLIASTLRYCRIMTYFALHDVMDTIILLLAYGRHIQISPRSIGWGDFVFAIYHDEFCQEVRCCSLVTCIWISFECCSSWCKFFGERTSSRCTGMRKLKMPISRQLILTEVKNTIFDSDSLSKFLQVNISLIAKHNIFSHFKICCPLSHTYVRLFLVQ